MSILWDIRVLNVTEVANCILLVTALELRRLTYNKAVYSNIPERSSGGTLQSSPNEFRLINHTGITQLEWPTTSILLFNNIPCIVVLEVFFC